MAKSKFNPALIIVIVLVVIMGSVLFRSHSLNKVYQLWPDVEATITSSKRQGFSIQVNFDYRYNDQTYTGQAYYRSISPTFLTNHLNSRRQGTNIVIKVDPDNPTNHQYQPSYLDVNSANQIRPIILSLLIITVFGLAIMKIYQKQSKIK